MILVIHPYLGVILNKLYPETKIPAGRPAKLKNGRDRTIYIDDESWEKARKLGDGKPSEGIRRALKKCLTQ